jgi:hypothetical protein
MRDAIKIGVIADQTGALSIMGGAQANVATLVVDEINASGGLLGRRVEQLHPYFTEAQRPSLLIVLVLTEDVLESCFDHVQTRTDLIELCRYGVVLAVREAPPGGFDEC